MVMSKQMPIGGDTTKLPFAEWLTEFERTLARQIHAIARQMPGSPQIRVMMGHCHFGVLVCLGDTLFLLSRRTRNMMRWCYNCPELAGMIRG